MSFHTTAAAAETDEKQQDVAVQDTTVPSWRIFVKTVGKGFDNPRVNDDGFENRKSNVTCADGSLSFHVNISPEDGIDLLHGEIEDITGVKASQQRLIYRGRLIGKSDVDSASHNGSTANNGSGTIDNSTVVCKDKAGQSPLSSCKNEPQHDYKIKDISGLCDGQTIHLVKKRDSESKRTKGSDTSNVPESGVTDENNRNTSNNTSRDSETSPGGGALLAALLGLETRFPEDTGSSAIGPPSPERRIRRNNNTNDQTATSTSSASPPWRSSRTTDADNETDSTRRSSRGQNRRAHYRLGTEELEVADPGSMESVRQGLMTLNTIMNSQTRRRTGGRGSTAADIHHPLEVNREWFRGQWIDARDTVNQWLEATVVDILDPSDVLYETEAFRNSTSNATFISRYGTPENPHQPTRQRPVPNIDNDPAIGATDVEGVRRLLLEDCEPGDPREITFNSNTESNQTSFQLPNSSRSLRPRASNNGVKLLLIHYNGWPHRWDEWIRSDSERLRPFRTRTRHPNNSSLASPTPQSIFNESPRTNISEHGSEEEDRFAVLPELNIALSRVSELLGELVQRDQRREDDNESKDCDDDELEDLRPSTTERPSQSNLNHRRAMPDLPWMARDSNNFNSSEEGGNTLSIMNEFDEEADGEEDPSNVAISAGDFESNRNIDVTTSYSQDELRNIATIFDRLGRTLTDAAPHIASIAASLPAQERSSSLEYDRPNEPTRESSNSFEVDTPSAPLGGLLSLWSRERERARRNSVVDENEITRPTTSSAPVDPDHLDFASGIINTTRGQVRSGPRSRSSHQDDVASLLGTYLAAASLGSAGSSNDEGGSGATSGLARLLARGASSGSGDSGIDIHIHAIVTTPGASPGGMGIATLSSGGGGSPTATIGSARNLFSSNRSMSIRSDGGDMRGGTSLSNFVEQRDEEDYNDLFSELYSESPTPIDPNGSPVQRDNGANRSYAAGRNANYDDVANNLSTSNMIDNNEQLESPGDTSVVTPTTNRSRSSPRRQGTGRRSGVFRLFGRRRSRPDDPDRSNNEDA